MKVTSCEGPDGGRGFRRPKDRRARRAASTRAANPGVSGGARPMDVERPRRESPAGPSCVRSPGGARAAGYRAEERESATMAPAMTPTNQTKAQRSTLGSIPHPSSPTGELHPSSSPARYALASERTKR